MNATGKRDAGSIFIAPGKTADDWRYFAPRLIIGDDTSPWAEAFEVFLLKRLESRYLSPIKRLQKEGPGEGEGFTIVSIQCALIEFLAACYEGRIYRHKNPTLTL